MPLAGPASAGRNGSQAAAPAPPVPTVNTSYRAAYPASSVRNCRKPTATILAFSGATAQMIAGQLGHSANPRVLAALGAANPSRFLPQGDG